MHKIGKKVDSFKFKITTKEQVDQMKCFSPLKVGNRHPEIGLFLGSIMGGEFFDKWGTFSRKAIPVESA